MNAPNFSIVTCAYNPSPTIFDRLLEALKKIKAHPNTPQHEIIIIDNNSSPKLAERGSLQQFLINYPETRVLVETKPGLTNARIAGVKAASNDWVVFFDDDNEPAPDFLNNAATIINEYPHVGVWGPGIITVEFLGAVSAFAREHKNLFQERSIEKTTIDNVRWGQRAYPIGTGMTVRKEILNEYIRNVESGIYTMTDRIGKSLISGGDIQILLTGIKIGWYAGSSPAMQLNHLIKKEKTEYKKMLQLVYMTSASAVKLYNEVFPDEPHSVSEIDNKRVVEILYTQLRLYLFKEPTKETGFRLARKMGELYAQVLAGKGQASPIILRIFQKLIS